MANIPLTGSWGKEKFEPPNKAAIYRSTATEMFDLTSQKDAVDMEKNKFAKFVMFSSLPYNLVISLIFQNKLKTTGQMVVQPDLRFDNCKLKLTLLTSKSLARTSKRRMRRLTHLTDILLFNKRLMELATIPKHQG